MRTPPEQYEPTLAEGAIMFSLTGSLCLHNAAPECDTESPHGVETCGLMAGAPVDPPARMKDDDALDRDMRLRARLYRYGEP